MKPARALLVGCGLIARAKYLPALRKLRGQIAVQGVCDRDEALARALASALGTGLIHTDLSEALTQIQPELVLLCTPPQTHRDLGIQALQAGAHLFMEKPMALSSADCRAMIAAAEQARRKICVCFSQSFTPVVLEAQRRIARGEIGKLTAMQIFLSTPTGYMTSQPDHWIHRLPGGVLSETGPHVIHLARRFLGPIQEARIDARKHHPFPWSLADDLRLNLRCQQGTCSVTLLYATDQWAAQVDLLGTSGRLRLDLEGGLNVLHRRGRLRAPVVFLSNVSDAVQTLRQSARHAAARLIGLHSNSQETLLRRFLKTIRDGAPLPVDPAEGLEVAQVLETLAAQAQGNSS